MHRAFTFSTRLFWPFRKTKLCRIIFIRDFLCLVFCAETDARWVQVRLIILNIRYKKTRNYGSKQSVGGVLKRGRIAVVRWIKGFVEDEQRNNIFRLRYCPLSILRQRKKLTKTSSVEFGPGISALYTIIIERRTNWVLIRLISLVKIT